MNETIPPQEQSTPSNEPVSAPATHPHLQYINDTINERIGSAMREFNDKNGVEGSISKDWIEKIASSIDNKIEMDRVKNEAKFEKIVSDSDAKFDKLFAEIKFESERNSSRIDVNSHKFESSIAKLETNITRWLIGIIIAIIGASFAIMKNTNHIPATNDQQHSQQPASQYTKQEPAKDSQQQ